MKRTQTHTTLLPRPFKQFHQWVKWNLWRLRLKRRGSFSQSTWISLVLRPFIEGKGFLSLIGAHLAGGMVMGAVMLSGFEPVVSSDTTLSPELVQFLDENTLSVRIDTDAAMETQESQAVMVPVSSFTGISQWYGYLHPALDLRAPLNSPVVAMKSGYVKSVIFDRYGYGRHVIVEHGDGLETLYAHMNGIYVSQDEKVLTGQAIGEIGMSGWSTGPHLHFETRVNARPVNPASYLEPAFERLRKQSSLSAGN